MLDVRFALVLLALGVALGGCAADPPDGPPPFVPASALDGALLRSDEMNAVLGTTGMTPHARVAVMGDNRNLLPNLNCLGIWQVNESAIYGTDDWTAMRQELQRSPDTDAWRNLAVQSVVLYPSAEAARAFFDLSADRWSKCTNHNVNITLNDQKLPRWRSGDLTKTDVQLAIPFTRGGDAAVDACQRVLAVANNVIVDVQACTRDSATMTRAVGVAEKIESKLPR